MIYTNNWIAIIAAMIASFAIGFLWYGPVFGKAWMKLSGHTMQSGEEMKKSGATPMRGYIVTLILGLVTPFVFFSLAQSLIINSFGEAAMLAFWIWLGFIAPIAIGSVLWEAKSWGLFFFNSANQLVTILVTALIYAWLVA